MEKIRVGIIGIGNIGSAHTRAIANGKVPGMELSALCDISEERLELLKEEFPDCAHFTDYKELVKSGKADAVIVSVPHMMHGEISEFALRGGLHVLVEKPVDVSVSVARRLNAAAEASGKVFGIMFNQRTNKLFSAARELVKSGALGNLKRSVWIVTNWYRTQKYYDSGDWRATWAGEGGGVLLNQAPHNLDLWQWICGLPSAVTAYCAEGKYHNIEVEDDVTILAEYENGATGTFITSTGEYPGTNRLEITGELGKLVLENGTLKFWKLPVSEREICYTHDEMTSALELEYTEIQESEDFSGHVRILQNFADAILRGAPLLAPGIEGICELMISNAAYLSSWTGNKKIALPFNEEEFDKFLSKKMKSSSYHEKGKASAKAGEYSSRWQVRW